MKVSTTVNEVGRRAGGMGLYPKWGVKNALKPILKGKEIEQKKIQLIFNKKEGGKNFE